MTKQSKIANILGLGNGQVGDDLPPELSEGQVAIADAQRAQALSMPQHGEAVELLTPSPEQMFALVQGACEDIGRAFTLEVERIKSTTDAESGEVTSETRIVNRLGFFQRTLLGTIVWKLERLASEMDDPRNTRGIPAQELQIRRTMERVSRDESVEGLLNQQIDWLEVLVDQRSCLSNAIAAAKAGYEAAVGQPYDKPTETPVTTVEVAAAAEPKTAQDRARARLAALAR